MRAKVKRPAAKPAAKSDAMATASVILSRLNEVMSCLDQMNDELEGMHEVLLKLLPPPGPTPPS